MTEFRHSRQEINTDVLSKVKYIFAIFGGFSLLVAAVQWVPEGSYSRLGFFLAAYFSTLYFLVSKKVDIKLKLRMIFVAIYLVATMNLVTEGFTSTAPLWMILLASLTALAFGLKYSLASLALSGITLISYAIYLAVSGNVPAAPDYSQPLVLIDTVFDILLIAFLTSTPASYVIQKLDTLIDKEQSHKQELETINKELLETNLGLDAFNYALSHDLKSPLGRISGFVDLLDEEASFPLDSKEQLFINRIKTATQESDELINAMLDLAKSARAKLDIQLVDISLLAKQAISHSRQRHGAEHIKVDIADSIKINCDQKLTTILVTNLIDNAVKYAAANNNATISVGLLENGGQAGFYVEDNGVGIPAGYEERIFEPFTRFHSDSRYAGSGIGLATVKRVVDKHGGSIVIQSSEGVGTRILVTLSN